MSLPGMGEMLVILAIVLIFFGVGNLPDVLGQMGKGVKAFKDGMSTEKERPKEIEADEVEEVENLAAKSKSVSGRS